MYQLDMSLDVEKMLTDLLGETDTSIYNNELCSVKIKMVKQEDVESLAEFIHHHRQSMVKNEEDIKHESVAEIEKKLRDGIGDETTPQSFYAIIAMEEKNSKKEDANDNKSTELKSNRKIKGAAILTTHWDVKESNNCINVEDLLIPEESSSCTTNALLLVLSVISLRNGLHLNDKKISILRYNKICRKSESFQNNDEEKKILSSE